MFAWRLNLWNSVPIGRALGMALLLAAMPPLALSGDDPDPEARALERLHWMRAQQGNMWNVTPSEGAFLRDLLMQVKAKRALEIGTSNGYSGIWIAMGLRHTGGHLITVEIDEGRARLAEENSREAGVDSLITPKLGDALKEVPRLQGPFEFVFIDAAKSDYVRYLEMVLPMVPPGGVIVAHNVTDLRASLEEFLRVVETHPQLKTTIENPGPGGFSVSYKLPSC